MQTLHTIAELRSALAAAGPCAFVPTMGNLHEGHLALIRQAGAHKLPVVASIFVNRLQFAPHEDFDRYPRTLAQDCDKLQAAGCDLVFAPDEAEMYPQPQGYKVHPEPALADILEGHFRPGFFVGVATIVMKLFGCVQPRVAIFGKKDYQQLLVLRRLVSQFNLPITVEGGETTRADDGLALSSRNGYLDAAQRSEAVALSRALRALADGARDGAQPLDVLEAQALVELTGRGWAPDYLTVRCRDTLLAPTDAQRGGPLVALGAARIGGTRLIDNLEF